MKIGASTVTAIFLGTTAITSAYLGSTQVFSSATFSPSSLFASSEPGTWFDPSDLTTLFQDTAGTVAVTTPGQTVARMNDKSGRGNNATQATAASRPTFGVVPLGGRRNLLLQTEALSNAAWTNNPITTVTSGVLDPDGGSTAFTLTGTTANSEVYQTFTGRTVGQAHTTQCWMRRRTGSGAIQLYANSSQTTVTLTSSWQLITLTQNASATTIYCGFRIFASGDAIDIWHPQFELGSTATSYQRVTTAFDVTEAGVQSLSYLSFDGVDDFMLTGTITPGVDKAQVFAGVRKLSDAQGSIVELAAASGTTGWLGLWHSYGVGPDYTLGVRGPSLNSIQNYITFTAPITNVLAAQYDFAGSTLDDELKLRANGATATKGAAFQGPSATTNFATAPLYIGRRGGSTLPFNGQIYSLITRFGANLTAGQVTDTETWVNSRTGAF
jgi:hypothetical protein